MRLFLALLAFAAAPAFGTHITATITGTCGFYQPGTNTVAYSESFTGNGTYCTGFMTGGDLNVADDIQLGNLMAMARNALNGHAPAGYDLFVQIHDTFTQTEQFLITGGVSTPTGFAQGFFDPGAGFEDSSGESASCQQPIQLTAGGIVSPAHGGVTFDLFDDFVSPITFTERIDYNCDFRVGAGGTFSDSGFSLNRVRVSTIFDSNKNPFTTANPSIVEVTTPEPSTFAMLALALGAGFLWRKIRTPFRPAARKGALKQASRNTSTNVRVPARNPSRYPDSCAGAWAASFPPGSVHLSSSVLASDRWCPVD